MPDPSLPSPDLPSPLLVHNLSLDILHGPGLPGPLYVLHGLLGFVCYLFVVIYFVIFDRKLTRTKGIL